MAPAAALRWSPHGGLCADASDAPDGRLWPGFCLWSRLPSERQFRAFQRVRGEASHVATSRHASRTGKPDHTPIGECRNIRAACTRNHLGEGNRGETERAKCPSAARGHGMDGHRCPAPACKNGVRFTKPLSEGDARLFLYSRNGRRRKSSVEYLEPVGGSLDWIEIVSCDPRNGASALAQSTCSEPGIDWPSQPVET